MEKIQKAIFYFCKRYIIGVAINEAMMPITITSAIILTEVFFFIRDW